MSRSFPTVTVVDVAHGSCTVITDGVSTVLIDTGPGNAVLEYLLQEGIKRVDVIVLSHADSDHIDGLTALLGTGEFEIGHILLNSDAEKGSEAWLSLAYDLDELRRVDSIEMDVQLREGDVIESDIPGLTIEVVAPRDRLIMLGPGALDRNGRRITTNTISAVLLVGYMQQRVAVISGDLDNVGLEHLLETGQDLRAAVLVFPHHGGLSGGSAATARAFTANLMRAVEPQSVAISLGRSRYENPREEVINGIRDVAPRARIACTQLSRKCSASVPAEPPTHVLPLFAQGGRKNWCCAGTMRIDLGRDLKIEPALDAHLAFIDTVAPAGAMCRR